MRITTTCWLLNSLLLMGLLGCQIHAENNENISEERSPNIIIIYADDMGYGDMGTYGNPTIRTPNFDKMAAEGLKFTQFYVGASVCTPSRAALMTGRLPIRSGMVSNQRRVLFPYSLSGIPAEEITLAEALKEQGYATGMIGKWHLGHHEEFLPTNNGFDSYFGIPYSNDMRPNPNSKWAAARKYPPLPLMEGTQIIETSPDQKLLTKRYTEKAKSFIQLHKDEPFFLYMPHTFPHIPLYASDDFEGKSTAGLYGDVIEELDWSVGEVMNQVKELGLEENTLVFFTSDNGPWLVMKDKGGSAGLLREGKGCTWEGGMREPAIAWWPGTIAPGQTTQSIATTMDLYATAVELGGGTLPDDRVMDGSSMVSIFENPQSTIRDEVFYYLGAELFAVRKGAWKMHYKTLTPYVGEKAVAHDPPLLYNLNIDPSEKRNLADDNPEILVELTAVADKHKATVKPVASRLEIVDPEMLK